MMRWLTLTLSVVLLGLVLSPATRGGDAIRRGRPGRAARGSFG
jgi:hypothetical protein